MCKIGDTQHPNVDIAVKNFGPIAEASIDLRPLTVFVGPSNTGKTYFATLVYALHGIVAGFPRVPLLNYMGPLLPEILLDPDSSDDSLLEERLRGYVEKLSTMSRQFKFSELPQTARNDVKSGLKNPEVFEGELKRCFNVDFVSKLLRLRDGQRHEMNVSLKVREADQELWGFELEDSGWGITVKDQVNEDMIIHSKEVFEATLHFIIRSSFGSGGHLQGTGRQVQRYYLPASRSGIMQSHKIIASSLVERATREFVEDPSRVATLAGGLADFLRRLILYKEDETPNSALLTIGKVLEADLLDGKIITKPSLSGYPDFLYYPRDMKEEILLSQAASVVSELAPLVLFLRSGIKPGDTLIIEEPEAHLHPGGQADMAVILARLVRAGVRVIVTTHSDWLLEELGNLILEGELANLGGKTHEPQVFLQKEQVGAWLFQKNGRVAEIEYDRLSGIEPQEYGDVAEELYNRSAELRNQIEELKGDSISG